MLRVGLTGGLGAGKSTALARFAALGAAVFSSDEIGRQMMQPGEAVYAAIVAHFGPSVVSADGSLDRPALARIAFGSDSEGGGRGGRIEELNSIVHPAVIARQLELLDEVGRRDASAVAIVESALIFETKYGETKYGEIKSGETKSCQTMRREAKSDGEAPIGDKSGFARRFDKLVFVRTAPELKIARFVARASQATSTHPAQSEEALVAEARRRIAQQIGDEQKAARCDFILTNDGSVAQLTAQVDALWPALKAAATLRAS